MLENETLIARNEEAKQICRSFRKLKSKVFLLRFLEDWQMSVVETIMMIFPKVTGKEEKKKRYNSTLVWIIFHKKKEKKNRTAITEIANVSIINTRTTLTRIQRQNRCRVRYFSREGADFYRRPRASPKRGTKRTCVNVTPLIINVFSDVSHTIVSVYTESRYTAYD